MRQIKLINLDSKIYIFLEMLISNLLLIYKYKAKIYKLMYFMKIKLLLKMSSFLKTFNRLFKIYKKKDNKYMKCEGSHLIFKEKK